MKDDYLIIHKSILPEYFGQVIKTRELIEQSGISVSDACKEMNISRSTFYKYKDFIFVPSTNFGKKAIVAFNLLDDKGILSNLLNFIASCNGNIVAINQEMPINGKAFVTITLDTMGINDNIKELLPKFKQLKGVLSANLVAFE